MKKKEFVEKLSDIERSQSPNGLTVYIDEAKFYDKPDLRSMWVLKGHPAEVVTYRSGRKKIITYGAFCPQNTLLYTEVVPEQTRISHVICPMSSFNRWFVFLSCFHMNLGSQ